MMEQRKQPEHGAKHSRKKFLPVGVRRITRNTSEVKTLQGIHHDTLTRNLCEPFAPFAQQPV